MLLLPAEGGQPGIERLDRASQPPADRCKDENIVHEANVEDVLLLHRIHAPRRPHGQCEQPGVEPRAGADVGNKHPRCVIEGRLHAATRALQWSVG